MAMEFDGFSIRDYASRMRAVDVMKCWPFGGRSGEVNKEVVEALLPPITVKQFRWWSDELGLLRSVDCADNEKLNSYENSSTELGNASGLASRSIEAGTVSGSNDEDEVNAHARSCLSQVHREEPRLMKTKSKWRAQKKRSIVEIFAVAPQVERVDIDDGDEEDEGSSQSDEFDNEKVLADIRLDNKSYKKSKKTKTKLKEETKKKKIKLKKRKRNETTSIHQFVQSIEKKVKSRKLKLQSPVTCTGKPNVSSCSTGLANDVLGGIFIHKMKPKPKCLFSHKGKNLCSKSIAKHQKPVIPARSILKSRSKVITGKNSKICNLQAAMFSKQCGVQPSDRHVRFSGQENVLGPRRNFVPSLGSAKLRSVDSSYSNAVASSIVKEGTLDSGKSLANVEVYESDEDVSVIGTENENEVRPITEKHLCELAHHVDVPNFILPRTSHQEHLSNRSETLHQVALHGKNLSSFDQNHRATPHDLSYGHYPRFHCMPKEGSNPYVNAQDGRDISRAANTTREVVENVDNPVTRVAGGSSMDNIMHFPRPSPSYVALSGNEDARLSFPSQTTENGQALQYPLFHHLSPKELINGIYSLADWKQRATCQEKCKADDFFGLPLNSQGELIHLNSTGKGGLNQLMRESKLASYSRSPTQENYVLPKSRAVLPNLSSECLNGRAPPKDQFDFFPVQSHVKANPLLPVSSRFGVTELQGSGRTDFQLLHSERAINHPLESHMGLLSISGKENKHDEMFVDHIGHKMVDSRKVPGNMSPNVIPPTMRLMGKEFSVGSTSNDLQRYEDGKVWMDKQIIVEHHAANTVTDNSLLNRQYRRDSIVHPVSGSINKPMAYSSESLLPPRSPELMSRPPYINCQTNTARPNSCGIDLGNPSSKSNSHSPPNVSPGSVDRYPYLQDPFMYGHESLKTNSHIPAPVSTPRAIYQNRNLGTTELKYKQKRPFATTSAYEFPFLHPDSVEHVQPSRSRSSSMSPAPWLVNASHEKELMMGSCRSSSAVGHYHPCKTSRANLQSVASLHNPPETSSPSSPFTSGSSFPNSIGQVAFPPPLLMPVRPGCIPSPGMYKSFEERLQVKNRMKKRVSLKIPDCSKKTKKRPATKLDIPMNPAKIANLEYGGSGGIKLSAGGSTIDCGHNHIQKDGVGLSSGIDISKLDVIGRSGPLKLTAGTKHILKPSQNLDQNNGKAAHSAIHSLPVTHSGKLSDYEKRSEKIFRL